jgi:hypothetical protein
MGMRKLPIIDGNGGTVGGTPRLKGFGVWSSTSPIPVGNPPAHDDHLTPADNANRAVAQSKIEHIPCQTWRS